MNETQKHLLKLIIEIDEICKKYDITYYLAGGGLLGAVRHQGFLPWDDDMDIHISRDNAEKFRLALEEESIKDRALCIRDEQNGYPSAHWRYEDTSTSCLQRSLVGTSSYQGQFVDIFINYPIPSDEKIKLRCAEDFEVYIEFIAKNMTVYSGSKRDYKYLQHYQKIKKMEKEIGEKKVLDWFEERIFSFSEETANDFLINSPAPPQRVVPKEWWGKPRYMKFESIKLPVPQYVEKFLNYEYDPTWFEVPAHEEREQHILGLDFDIPYSVYTAEYDKYIDSKEFYKQEIQKKDYWFEIIENRNVVNPIIHNLQGRKIVLEVQSIIEKYNIDIRQLIVEGRKQELSVIFKPYFDYLSVDTSRYWGLYVDMPDDYFYAAFYFSCFDGNYGLARKVLAKRRELETRELSEELSVLCEICDATDEMLTMLYGELDYDAAEKLVEKWLEKYPNLLYFMRAKMYLDLQKITVDNQEQLLEQCEQYLELYEKDGELLKYKGDLLMRIDRVEEAEKCYRMALNTLRNGYCITEIKEYFESKAAGV